MKWASGWGKPTLNTNSPMPKKTGRKSMYEEVKIKERFTELAPKAFAVLVGLLDSKSPDDQKWAVEQCMKGFAKMIPQEISGTDGGPIEISWLDKSSFLTVHADGQNSSTSHLSVGLSSSSTDVLAKPQRS